MHKIFLYINDKKKFLDDEICLLAFFLFELKLLIRFYMKRKKRITKKEMI